MKILLFFLLSLFYPTSLIFGGLNPNTEEMPTPIVYNIAHEFSMNRRNNTLQKDYFLTLGENQGVFKDTLVDVYRIISKNDPYQNNRTYTYKIVIGTLRIIHSQKSTAIARMHRLYSTEDTPIQEVPAVMIGDYISVR